MSLLKTGEMNGVRAGSSRRSYWQDEAQIDVVDADDQLLTQTPPDGDIALSLLIDVGVKFLPTHKFMWIVFLIKTMLKVAE
ncbi:hypothetical protein TNIN_48221 [Trichonephila inaurata madagascariensis]|uniref:Uncharacterized protein n=1 Tax=Trichonephila inaurata madagascariensis TaxID=2747483 RepID=A0A8X6YNI8_9ARAC|nr:hypothetical protein TNIN_48221 [Trichonephila inaurata madagascariensis]